MACSAIATNCPAIVASWRRLAYCRMVACCTGTVAALIESPRSPDSSTATGHSFWWWVAVDHKIARPRSRPFRSARASRFVLHSTADAGPRRHNNSDPEPSPALPSALHSHTDGPAAAPRSWFGFHLVFLGVVSESPKNNRSSSANVPVPAIVPAGSNQRKPRASSSARLGSAPSSVPSVVARNSVRVWPRTVPGARSLHTPSAPWLALPPPPEPEPNRSWSAPLHIRSRSPPENE